MNNNTPINSTLITPPKRIQTTLKVTKEQAGNKLFDFLANVITPSVSKASWKKCIEAGGIWLRNNNQKKRLKRVTCVVQEGDIIEVFFDPHVLESSDAFKNSPPLKIFHQGQLSCWYKPANMLTQGSPYGDQSSLQHFVSNLIKPTFLLHRLDRETEGLVLFAHHKEMAAKCNAIFSEHKIQKSYFALIVKKEMIEEQMIDVPIDKKNAMTKVENPSEEELKKIYEKYPETKDLQASWVRLLPISGRKHQLRIHMQHLGRPLLHDPRYSRTHKKGTRLYLIAYAIECEELKLKITLF